MLKQEAPQQRRKPPAGIPGLQSGEHVNQGPIPGVYEIDAETSAQIHASGDESKLDELLADIDRQRLTPP